MQFHYRVRDPLGNEHEGEIDAPNNEAATQQLRQSGFHVLQLEEESEGALLPRRISRAHVVYFTSQLAIMVETGITVSTALQNIAEQEENPTFRKIITDLKNSVESGDDFSASLARYPKLFDKTYVSLVRASEQSGGLGVMLDRIAGYLRKELEMRGKVRAAMAYPTIMLVLAIAVTIFLLTFILPKFTPLFTSKGLQLPKPTILMMAVSHYLIHYWYLWLIGAVTAIIGFVYGRKTEPGRKCWDKLKISAPLLGPMLRKVTISRSIRTLGTMISSGVPMLESIQLSAEVAGNYYFERLWREVQEQVTGGSQLCDALARNPLFPRMLVQMISSGESTGQLDTVLTKISNYYDQEVETSVKTVTSLIEPIMITIMGVVVGGIGLALLLPIFSLSRHPG